MKFYGITFFVKEDDKTSVWMRLDLKDSTYPVTLSIGETPNPPCITVHMGERNFIQFKNSVLDAFRKYETERKEVSDEAIDDVSSIPVLEGRDDNLG